MLKSDLFPSGRNCIYWDGAALVTHADTVCDSSLNWLDLPAMAPPGAAHVWIAPVSPPERRLKAAIAAYEAALRALGVDCRPALRLGAAMECLRCGHGWDDHARAMELALGLAVLEDAVADHWDVALVFASPRVVAALASSVGRLFPDKRLARVTFGPAPQRRSGVLVAPSLHLAAIRLPPFAKAHDGALIAQPACWRTVGLPRHMRSSLSPSPTLVQPA